MARRAPAATPPSGASGPRVRRSRSKAATEATRAMRASVDALTSEAALRAADHLDPKGWALRYLEAGRPTSIFVPAHPSAEDMTKMAYAQADQMVGVVRAVLEGLKLSDEDYTRGIDIAIKELRAASAQGWDLL
jgi:hypothetical protein